MISGEESEFERWIERARLNQLSDSDIAELASRLAASGEQLSLQGKTADLASTGGPGSLSTLWAPAALVASGLLVPKLGVPGRPAGGIDALCQVPGYRVDLNGIDARAVLERCGYVHVIAGTTFAPADAAMFAYRQRTGAQAIPELAIASLLSKKLAMGVKVVGLEVRVARHGNFGANREDAKTNAQRFARVAKLLGIEAVSFLTDGMTPQQPYLGRGEALLALSRLFAAKACPWLEHHALACEGWTSALARSAPPSRLGVAHAFACNILAQGGSVEGLEERASNVAAAHSRIVPAIQHGVISYDLSQLRAAILDARGPDTDGSFSDSAGLILLAMPGTMVRKGQPLVSLRCADSALTKMYESVLSAVRLNDQVEAIIPGSLLNTLEVVGVGDR
ncbi:hypothetical protein [Sinorhizobium meliloti]|uniref:hypothetical protein n=1 Tax=Rhizobium meliloti TaxID=382 RepID=UPI0003FE2B9E|nr:hypothetical protein [Sinorhizobium meliloti]